MHACCQRETLKEYSKRSLSWHWHNKTSILGLKGVSVAKAIKGFASEPTGASQNVPPDPPDPKKLSFGFSVKYFLDISAAAKTYYFSSLLYASLSSQKPWPHRRDFEFDFTTWIVFSLTIIYHNPSFLPSISMANY